MPASVPHCSDPSSCGGVVVTYRPDPGFAARLAAMCQEVGRMVVVDNTATSATSDSLAAIRAHCGCQLLCNDSNLGTAAALNRGFAELERLGCRWAVAFDQDSTPEAGLVAHLRAYADRQPDRPAAVVGSNWIDAARGGPSRFLTRHPSLPLCFKRVTAERDLPAVTTVIMSGALFSLAAWRALGGFDESLFLDLVDADYCLRTRRAGRAVSVAANARLLHPRGRKRAVRFLGRTWWPAFMPTWRLHHLFRNRVLLFRRHAWREPHWAAFEITYALKILAEVVFLEDQTFAKLGACLRGTWDGVWGRRRPLSRPSP